MNAHNPAKQSHSSRDYERHGGVLYPLLLVAAIAIIVFSIIGIATMTGIMPNGVSRDAEMRQSGAEEQSNSKPARNEAPRRDRGPQPGNPRSAMTLQLPAA